MPHIPHGATWALVPLKGDEHAKSRLASVLDRAQRQALVSSMAAHVIGCLRGARGIDAVAVVTASPALAGLARSHGAIPLMQPADLGMSHALDAAVRNLDTYRPARVLMVPGDLPLLSSRAVEEILEAGLRHRVVLAPDRHGIGTNALLYSSPVVLAPCFGGHSLARHLATARSAGVEPCILKIDALAYDLDTPADLAAIRETADRDNLPFVADPDGIERGEFEPRATFVE